MDERRRAVVLVYKSMLRPRVLMWYSSKQEYMKD